MSTAVSIRTTLSATARQLAAEDPTHAVERFRSQISPFLEAGRAWVVEPAVRVLLTELRRNPSAWPKVGDEARLLLEQSEDAQINSLELALRQHEPTQRVALVDTGELGREILDAAPGKSSPSRVETLIAPIRAVEDVEVSWVALDSSSYHSLFEPMILGDDRIRMIDKVIGPAVRIAAPGYVFSPGHRPTSNWLRILDYLRAREGVEAQVAPLQQRILGAMFAMPPDQAMLITLIDGDAGRPPTAEVLVAHVGAETFAELRAIAKESASVAVRRPVDLDFTQAAVLAKSLFTEAGLTTKGTVGGFNIGVNNVEIS